MSEINDGNGIKTIAFYLPQFHAIPENDKAWGEGFTEWTNTRKAKPLFDGHRQPRTPLNENYYNLLDDDVKKWQSELAQRYGVFGFCYYHYWFKNGKMLLEKPAEQMLKNKAITIPFCFSWANENWSKLWDGGNKELIVEQDYGGINEWKKHFEYLLPFFKDDRYITLDGKPVFLIYKPQEIREVNSMIECWQREAQNAGLKGICFMIQNASWLFNPSKDLGGFSYQIKFQPFFMIEHKGKDSKKMKFYRVFYSLMKRMGLEQRSNEILKKVRSVRHKNEKSSQRRIEYDDTWKEILQFNSSKEYIEGAFVDWDNTARKKNGLMHLNATPEKFGIYMRELFKKIVKQEEQQVVFINAWNEWCEGAYLEPDTVFGYKYLEALRDALVDYQE